MRIEPKHLDGVVALAVADQQGTTKHPGEKDTEFIKRIVAAYLNLHAALTGAEVPLKKANGD